MQHMLNRLRSLFRRTELESDLDEELKFHVEMKTRENLAAGMPLEEARAAALKAFGNLARAKENTRTAWALPRLESFLQDLRYGLRQLRRNPGFTCTAIFTLALGFCASVAIFAFVDAALIKPLPYPSPNRLVDVTESISQVRRANLSYPDYVDWKRLNKVFNSMDAWTATGYLLRTSAGTQPVSATRVTAGFFRTVGVTPLLGHDFNPSDGLAGAPHTLILSYGAWQKLFEGKQSVVGEQATLSGVSYTIIGVLPRDFQFAPRGHSDFWTALQPTSSCDLNRSCHDLYGIARLKDGVDIQTARADLATISQQLEKQYPDSNRGQGASVMPLSEVVVGNLRPLVILLLSGAGLLWLIACVNVTSLLLVRAESRKREIAVRSALGASRTRIVRLFLIESLVLATVASTLGLISAGWVIQLLAGLVPADMMGGMPFLQGLSLNLHVLAFAGVISLLSAALFAVTPTPRLLRPSLRDGLAEGGRASAGTLWHRLGTRLVVAELAIAAVLLVGAGLLGKSFYRLLGVDLGFQPDHLATLQVAVPEANYKSSEKVVALGREIVRRISNLPGVTSAGIASQLPVSFNGNTDWIRFVGRPYNGEHNEVNQRDVSSRYFTTLQAKLVRGRYFTDAEDASKPLVVIINQTLSRKYFPGEDPIGRKIGDTTLSPKSIKEIIGVVDDVRDGSLDSEIWPAVYYPFNQDSDTYFSVVVRTSQTAESLLTTLHAVIHQIDPGLGTMGEATMREKINDSPTAYLHRSSTWLVGGFAALALLLGVVGLYGVIAYSVSQRTREIGIRMALGAQRRTVYRLILGEAARLAGLGIVAGLGCSLAATRLMSGLLFGVRAWDLPTLAAVAAVLAISALLASYIPARRATKVDPMVALRCD
jgi:predicted permease